MKPDKNLLNQSNAETDNQSLNQTQATNVDLSTPAVNQTQLNNNSTIHDIQQPEQSAFDDGNSIHDIQQPEQSAFDDGNFNQNQSLFDTMQISPHTTEHYSNFSTYTNQVSNNAHLQAATPPNLDQINEVEEEHKLEESDEPLLPNFNRQSNITRSGHGNREGYASSSECVSNDYQSFVCQEEQDLDSVEEYVTVGSCIKNSAAPDKLTTNVKSVFFDRPAHRAFDDSHNSNVGARFDAHLSQQNRNAETTHYLQTTIHDVISDQAERNQNDANVQEEVKAATQRMRNTVNKAKQHIEDQKDKILEQVQEAAENTSETSPEPRSMFYDTLWALSYASMIIGASYVIYKIFNWLRPNSNSNGNSSVEVGSQPTPIHLENDNRPAEVSAFEDHIDNENPTTTENNPPINPNNSTNPTTSLQELWNNARSKETFREQAQSFVGGVFGAIGATLSYWWWQGYLTTRRRSPFFKSIWKFFFRKKR